MRVLIVWICNCVVALLSLLAILCYFLAPVWQIGVSYKVDAETFEKMMDDMDDLDIDFNDAFGDGVEVSLSLRIDMNILISSISADGDATVSKFIDSNVNSIVDQLNKALKEILPNVVKSVAKQAATNAIKDQVEQYLKNQNLEFSGDVSQKLEDVGVDEDYISQEVNKIIDEIYSEGATKESVSDTIVSVVETTYEKIAQSNDTDFHGAELSDEDKAEIRNSVEDTLAKMSDEDGNIDIDRLLDQLILDALRGLNEEDGENTGAIELLAVDDEDLETQIKKEVRSFITDIIPDSINDIMIWVFRGLFILVAFSMFTWVYILIKLIVKLCKLERRNPTVRLGLPIWLGWLPYLLLAGIPTLVFWLFTRTFLFGILEGTLPAGLNLGNVSISFMSSGWIAAVAAGICIVISIFYMNMRKGLKRKEKEKD